MPTLLNLYQVHSEQIKSVYLSAPGRQSELVTEIGDQVLECRERLVFSRAPANLKAAWCHNIWLEPQVHTVSSIAQAAKILRQQQRNWHLHSVAQHRRAHLIQDQLPAIRYKPFIFGSDLPRAPLGSWTLLDANTVLASAACSSPFPDGEIAFQENKAEPPSRAYLKLWEFFTKTGVCPKKGEICIDLGSSPGGWTWALSELGCRVISVDKAPIQSNLLKRPNVEYREQSAFSLRPQEVGPVDWLFSDVICYPKRLLMLIRAWLKQTTPPKIVCTIKFQGKTDTEILNEFSNLPGAKLIHLFQNKHELTFYIL